MPLEVKCDGCGREFRAPDKLAGKRVKCPQCQAVILVGAAPTEDATEKPAARAKTQGPSARFPKKAPAAKRVQEVKPVQEVKTPEVKPVETKKVAEWHVQGGDGEEYGPVTKSELDGWVVEGRLDANCQLLKDGWDQWKWADDVYPELGAPAAPQPEPDNLFLGIGADVPAAEANPFVSPVESSAATPVATAAEASAVTPRLRRALADTKPWVVFLAILGFIAGGLGTLGGLALIAMSAMARASVGILMGLAVLITPALYLIASYFLLTYGLRIGNFLRSGAQRELEGAMVAQKSFWKLVGIVTLVVLVLDVLLVVAVMSLGGFVAGSPRPPLR